MVRPAASGLLSPVLHPFLVSQHWGTKAIEAALDHTRRHLSWPSLRRAASPDSARVEWMNTLTEQLWPHIERAASKLLLKDGFLENLLNSTTFWRPPMLYGATVQVQAVILGQVRVPACLPARPPACLPAGRPQ